MLSQQIATLNLLCRAGQTNWHKSTERQHNLIVFPSETGCKRMLEKEHVRVILTHLTCVVASLPSKRLKSVSHIQLADALKLFSSIVEKFYIFLNAEGSGTAN